MEALEDAVDAQFLAWSPGNFDSSPDNVNTPSQIPPSYTHETFPYGWSGFASVGWFHGLSTLNNNVHAVNSDPTSDSYSSKYLLGLDQETTLGTMLQKAADPRFRLPEGVKPSKFFEKGDPTPGEPGINQVIKMPGYPRGSIFMLNGLMANSPGMSLGSQINGMSAYTSAPYLHDGGVAATATALQQQADGSYDVAKPDEMGMAGTLMQNRSPDPETSLRVLVDRQLRQVAVAANRDNPDLQTTHVDGSGHEYWVDQQAGFNAEDQTALIQFLLSLDDEPSTLPALSLASQ